MAKKKKVVKKTPKKVSAKKVIKPKKTASKPKSKPKKSAPAVAGPAPVITHEMVAKRAYELWLKKSHGAHSNNSVQNWLEAETELRASAKK
jgi:hypothetical protein